MSRGTSHVHRAKIRKGMLLTRKNRLKQYLSVWILAIFLWSSSDGPFHIFSQDDDLKVYFILPLTQPSLPITHISYSYWLTNWLFTTSWWLELTSIRSPCWKMMEGWPRYFCPYIVERTWPTCVICCSVTRLMYMLNVLIQGQSTTGKLCYDLYC